MTCINAPDHVMVDLETVDNCPTAGIISIGAVCFKGPNDGKLFYCPVDMQSSLDLGLTSSPETLRWWSTQSAQARAVFSDTARVDVKTALRSFGAFLAIMHDVRVWGNGASFDNAILQTAYRLAGLQLPWAFWNDRCYRTAAAGITTRRVQKGTHHNALDDAISQAEHLTQFRPEAIV